MSEKEMGVSPIEKQPELAESGTEMDITEQLLTMRFSGWQDFLNKLWQEDPNRKIVINLPRQVLMTQPQIKFLEELRNDDRVTIIVNK